MPTLMMFDLHTNMLTYNDNAMAIGPSSNPHNASALTINNMVRPEGKLYSSSDAIFKYNMYDGYEVTDG